MPRFDLARFLAVLAAVGPVMLTLVPGAEKIGALIPVVVAAIGDAEQIKGATGPQKKAHVLAIVAAGVAVANSTGKLKLDAAEVAGVASGGIDTVIAAIHVANGAKVQPLPPAA